jgi:hypothetical protein
MIDRRIVTGALLAGAATFMIGADQTRAQTAPRSPVRNVVLVHGLYADGSCWLKVIPLLQKAGLNVEAVQNPLRSLDEDCEFTRRTLALQDGPTVLVAHSPMVARSSRRRVSIRKSRRWSIALRVRLAPTRIMRRSARHIPRRRPTLASFTPTAMPS